MPTVVDKAEFDLDGNCLEERKTIHRLDEQKHSFFANMMSSRTISSLYWRKNYPFAHLARMKHFG